MLAGGDIGRVNLARGMHGRLVERIGRRILGGGMAPGRCCREAEPVQDFDTLRRALNQAFAAVRVGDADAAGRAMEQIIEDARIELERATGVPE
jgi:hypothetical protein